MEIHLVLNILIAFVWIYVIYILFHFLFYRFSIKYQEENPDKNTFKIPRISLILGVLILLAYFFKRESLMGFHEELLMFFIPLFILDGLMAFMVKGKIRFGKKYFFRHEDFTRFVKTKQISRIERRKESLSFIDHSSISPILFFKRNQYSAADWKNLNEFIDVYHHQKIVEFY